MWGFEERETLMTFYERASGSRLHANYFRTGGVHQDIPNKLIDDIEKNSADLSLKLLMTLRLYLLKIEFLNKEMLKSE